MEITGNSLCLGFFVFGLLVGILAIGRENPSGKYFKTLYVPDSPHRRILRRIYDDVNQYGYGNSYLLNDYYPVTGEVTKVKTSRCTIEIHIKTGKGTTYKTCSYLDLVNCPVRFLKKGQKGVFMIGCVTINKTPQYFILKMIGVL
jgi:hypothetical protein